MKNNESNWRNPCRFASSRFPGKPLALIDQAMMWHVYQRCLESEVLDEVYIATDDERIRVGAETWLKHGDDW